MLRLIRNGFRYASREYWDQIAKDVSPVCTAPNETAPEARFAEFTEQRGGKYPAIIALRPQHWTEFAPYLDHDVEIRKVICSTNAIESLNARYERSREDLSSFFRPVPRTERCC